MKWIVPRVDPGNQSEMMRVCAQEPICFHVTPCSRHSFTLSNALVHTQFTTLAASPVSRFRKKS